MKALFGRDFHFFGGEKNRDKKRDIFKYANYNQIEKMEEKRVT